MEHILSVQGLCRGYSGFELKEVSFALPKGCIMGLIGENGSGKTTIFKLILNQIRRDAGTIELLGYDNLRQEREAKQDVGVVFDENFFYQSLRAEDIAHIMKPMYPKWDDKLYQNYLERFSLPARKTIKEYSRGMKMKLSIAAALSHHPRLLLLDEATGGLDPVVREELLDVFLDFIQDEDNGILISSHISGDIERIADYITYIHQGKVKLSACKDDLLSRYAVAHCTEQELARLDRSIIKGVRRSRFSVEALVSDRDAALRRLPGLALDPARLDDLMLYTTKGEAV